MKFLYGLHDPGGEHLFADAKGWIVFTEAIGRDPADKSGRDYRQWSDAGYGVLVRVNNGYGSTGTIPEPQHYDDFAVRVANFIAASKGCDTWIVGNETNHSQERPNGQPITPPMYIDCFKRVHAQVRLITGTRHGLVPAPVALWNVETGDWLNYQEAIWRGLWRLSAGVAIHTYSHGASPQLITSMEKMGAPFQDRFYHFQAYRNLMTRVPVEMRGLPAYITESNQNDPWTDANTGWVQEAYAEIDRWNKTDSTQKIHCLCLYRWPDYDRWGIVNKPGVHADLRAAVAKGYKSPKVGASSMSEQTFIPTVAVGKAPRDIDPRATGRGVKIREAHDIAGGDKFWRVKSIRWYDEQEADRLGPDHHIMVDVLDEQGKRVADQRLFVKWPTDSTELRTEAKPGEPYSANYPMSPSRNEFSIGVLDGRPTEIVEGIGMGADTPGGFNAGIHTSTGIVFQLATHGAKTQPQPQQPTLAAKPHEVRLPIIAPGPTPAQPPAPVPDLAHPVRDPQYRFVTQPFGARPAYYSQFSVDGVPLKGHNGIDFGTPVGSVIQAVDGGEVMQADYMTDYGNVVKLRHVWGESVYAHLLGFAPGIKVGEVVQRGQEIATSGNSGNSSGPHLHFGLRVYPYSRRDGWDGFVDPARYLQNAQPLQKGQREMVKAIAAAALEFDIDSDLLLSQAWAESSFDSNAVSSAGAKGLMQIMDATWAEWSPRIGAGSDPFDPQQNARVGAAYLKWLLGQTGGNVYQALIAYGWGIGNVLSGRPAPDLWIAYSNKIVHGRDLLKAVG